MLKSGAEICGLRMTRCACTGSRKNARGGRWSRVTRAHSYLAVAIMSSQKDGRLMQFVIMRHATHVDLCIFGLAGRRQRPSRAVQWTGREARVGQRAVGDLVPLQVPPTDGHCRNIWHDRRPLPCDASRVPPSSSLSS